jgi:hypothetical protein
MATHEEEFWSIYSCITNYLVWVPPSPPASWNHEVRRKFPDRSLILNDLEIKSLRTNGLAAILLRLVVKECPKMGLGRLRWRSWEIGAARPWPTGPFHCRRWLVGCL